MSGTPMFDGSLNLIDEDGCVSSLPNRFWVYAWNDRETYTTGEGMGPLASVRKERCDGGSYFLAFLSARFSFRDLAGFFFVSFFVS